MIDLNEALRAMRLSSHREDIDRMIESGFHVNDCTSYIEVNVAAFKELNRCDFDTICPGLHPDEPNCRAYPTNCGGWSIHRYGTRAEQEKPGWHNNGYGYASIHYPGPKPVIDLSEGETTIADRTADALPSVKRVFQRAAKLCRVTYGSPPPMHVKRAPDAPAIEIMPLSEIRLAIAEAVTFTKWNDKHKKAVPCPQPAWLASAIENRANYKVPTIETVSRVPMFLPNGEILDRPGFHAQSGIYYAPACTFGDLMPVSEAVTALTDVLSDFPFFKPEHRSAAIAGILTPLARPAFPGPAPLFLIEGNRPAAGKGLLSDVIAEIALAFALSRMSAPDSASDDEWRKRVTSIAIAGELAVLLDNLSGKLKSASLDAALTSTSWADRRLGENSVVRVPMQTVFFGTANNLTLNLDTVRRTCHIRLESPLEKPELRADFRYPNLLEHVRKNRGTLTAAALSLLRLYHLAGRPDQGLKPWGSFEHWSNLIRNAVVWAGLPDPDTREHLAKANDSESDLLNMLLDGWQEVGTPMTCQEAIEAADAVDGQGEYKHPTLKAAIDELDGNKKNSLGQKLKSFKGRLSNGKRFEIREGRVNRWIVI